MMDKKPFARAGERLMDSTTGKVICLIKNDLYGGDRARSADFHEFAEGESPFAEGGRPEKRYFRFVLGIYSQLFIEGQWRFVAKPRVNLRRTRVFKGRRYVHYETLVDRHERQGTWWAA